MKNHEILQIKILFAQLFTLAAGILSVICDVEQREENTIKYRDTYIPFVFIFSNALNILYSFSLVDKILAKIIKKSNKKIFRVLQFFQTGLNLAAAVFKIINVCKK